MMTADWTYLDTFGTVTQEDWDQPPVVTVEGQDEFAQIVADGVKRIIETTKQYCATASLPAETVLVDLLKDTPLVLTNVVVDAPVEGDTVN
jgi:hypothetical protein